MKLIHITDLHLVSPGRSLYGTVPAERFSACIESICLEHNDADLCVITGDLAHLGETEAYQELAEILTRLEIPVRLVVGNHDHRQKLCQQFPDLEIDEHGFIQSVQKTPEGTFIFMDTVKEGTHAGAYCEKRQQWLNEQLKKRSGDDVFLFMHHAPFKTGIKSMDKIGMDSNHARELKDIIQSHGSVRHLFFGHYHRPIYGSWANSGFSSLRGMNHQVVLDLKESDDIYFNHEPPEYSIALIDREQIVIHNHDFTNSSIKFISNDASIWS